MNIFASTKHTFAGIDPALNKMGVCVIQNNIPVLLKRIKVPRKTRGPKRLLFLRDTLRKTLLPFQGKIMHASIEAQSLGSIGDIDQLGQVNGIVQVVLVDLGVHHLFKVPPASLKKFVTNHPSAPKKRMMEVSEQLWGIAFDNDDVCDAHGLARISEEFIEKKSMLRHQIEVVRRLSTPRKQKARIKKIIPKSI